MKLLFLFAMFTLVFSATVAAQTESQRVTLLESRVSALEGKVQQVGDAGLVLFLFGAVCALWAQNTGRSAWLWFFLGLFFSIVTVLVLLVKNSEDIDRRNNPPPLLR